jgi:hypothetical protein
MPPSSTWRTRLFDVCSGGIGMAFDAFFCGSCVYHGLQGNFGDQVDNLGDQVGFKTLLCMWLNPFWMCSAHAQLRRRVIQHHNITVRRPLAAWCVRGATYY